MSDSGSRARPRPEVSVVVPVFNNEGSLEELRARLDAALRAEDPYEIVFVDDDSLDGSRSVLHRLAARDPAIRVIELETNRGQHHAALAGLRVARGRWVVLLDADLQDPPEAIPALLRRGRAGFQAVFAGRAGAYQGRGRMLTSSAYRKLLTSVLRLPRGAGMFLALRRDAVSILVAMEGPPSHLVAMIGAVGLRTTAIPVARHRRAYGRSAYTARARARTALLAARWALSRR